MMPCRMYYYQIDNFYNNYQNNLSGFSDKTQSIESYWNDVLGFLYLHVDIQ